MELEENVLDVGIYLKPHFRQELRDPTTDFPLTSAGKPQNSLLLYPGAIFKSIVTIQLAVQNASQI